MSYLSLCGFMCFFFLNKEMLLWFFKVWQLEYNSNYHDDEVYQIPVSILKMSTCNKKVT